MMQNTLENVQEFFLKANFVVLAGFQKLCFFLLVTDRTFGSGSVVRPNQAVRPGSAEPPNQQILPNQNRTNHKLKFYLIFEFPKGYLMISLLMKNTNYYLKTDP